MSEAVPPFFTRYGFSRTSDPAAPLEIEPYAEICEAGTLRATVIASAIDLVGGLLTREIAGVDALMTTDLSLRIPCPGRPARLLARGERLRAGRRLVTSAIHIESEGRLYAAGETTFLRAARTPDEAPPLEDLQTPAVIESHPLSRPLAEEVGIESDPSEPGRVRLTLRPQVLNPEGLLQGALVALLMECAALSLAAPATDRDAAPLAVSALDLRYLAANAAGPVVASAEWLGPRKAGMLRVVLRDTGRGDRQTATALVGLRPLGD